MSNHRRFRRNDKSRSHEEMIPIPRDKVGLVIGRKGSRLQEIRDQTGVQIFIKDNHAHLRGTAEQCQNAEKVIKEILKVRTGVPIICRAVRH